MYVFRWAYLEDQLGHGERNVRLITCINLHQNNRIWTIKMKTLYERCRWVSYSVGVCEIIVIQDTAVLLTRWKLIPILGINETQFLFSQYYDYMYVWKNYLKISLLIIIFLEERFPYFFHQMTSMKKIY